jgi:hypothetical protein
MTMTKATNSDAINLGGTTTEQFRELRAEELDLVSAGLTVGPITIEDGFVAIGIPGVIGVVFGNGCIGGWLGGTGIAYCR